MNGLEDLLESTSLIGESTLSNMMNNNNHGSIEEEWNSEVICRMCNNQYVTPRLLSCLHVFCESCLNNALNTTGSGDIGVRQGTISCVQCSQETKIGPEGVSGLPLDFMINNALDLKSIHDDQVVCTACVTKEKAVARCKDCAQFLCTNCTTAHQFMKCFDNHNVIFLKELLENKKALSKIHKSIYCDVHNSDLLSLYCYSCQQPICKTCRLTDHKPPHHQTESSAEALIKQKEDLNSLVMESQGKIAQCEQLSNNSDELLSELECEHDNAKGLIDETYQSYKNILEQYRDELIEQLETVHKQRELKIMDSMNVLEKTIERVEQACKYTNNLLDKGSEQEILSLKKHVGNQLLNLINNTPKPDTDVTFQFVTDADKFKQAVKSTFGKVVVNMGSASTSTSTSTPHEVSPFPTGSNSSGHPSSSAGLGGGPPLMVNTNGIPGTISLASSSMTSSPISMLSSFEDFANTPSSVIPPPIPASNAPGNIHGLSLIQEYNLAQLAHLVAGTVDKPPSPPPLPMITPPVVGGGGGFSIADLFTGGDMNANAFNNIQALAKLGSSGLGDSTDLSRPTPPTASSGNLLNNSSPILPPSAPPTSLYSPSVSSSTSLLSPDILSSEISPSLSMQSYQSSRSKQIQTMQIRIKFGTIGSGNGQFSSPHGFCLGMDEDIVVADTNNHRIQVFDKDGNFKFQFGSPGKEEGQLWYPRKVAVLKTSGKFVVCDRGSERSRMQIFSKSGHFLRKIAIRYIDIVAGLAVTPHGLIVAVDSVSPTVFNITENGDLLTWFDCSEHMREPSDIAVNGKEYFVCDFKGHCVVVFDETGNFLRRIGFENITNFPNGIDISGAGDVLVGDSHGNRFHVAVFSRMGQLVTEFECPYVKVSRCCGLKITSEGFVVTLAKNNHHVLVLNTLYIQ
ncbi:hypothetical protein M8J77_022099 [Diaphorina citri]|nr:hypothetical protein M8J77_022099 [Diaphorina citri]